MQNEPQAMAAPMVHERALSLVQDHLPPPARCIDLAAGQGAFSLRLHRARYDVLAVDAVAEDFRVPEVPLQVQDLDGRFAQALGPGSFDGCVALEILEHVRSPYHFLRECRALLRPGGLLFLSSPNVESVASRLLFLWNGRLRYFTADETHHVSPVFGWYLQRGLAEAGFELLRTAYNRSAWECGESLKARVGGLMARVLSPLVSGSQDDKDGEIRLVVAKAV
jgi:2-polyprenyl-3-methyl-5-hydroxy-6-metoxy-1,4-benzoquinol methylase